MDTPHIKYTKFGLESQVAFNPLPAVAIGGPPHSGKSVLAYSLTRALRQRNIPHYVLRAYPPDYEGDWFYEGAREWVHHLRIKGARSEAWLPLVQQDVARRHLPLIVDMGGLPTAEQERILDECTHAILLTPDVVSRQVWEARMAQHGLVLLADLHSELRGENRLVSTEPLLQGTLAGLERRSEATGPAFEALIVRLSTLFKPATRGLRRRHLEAAPVELAVDLAQLAEHLGLAKQAWLPSDLPEVLEYLPQARPLGLYGRGPNWLYAAVAAHARPAPFALFDVRRGWVEAPPLEQGSLDPDSPLAVQRRALPEATLLEIRLLDAYLDISEARGMRVPCTADGGIILSGKLPHWLWAGLVRVCQARWVAVLQSQTGGAAVVASEGEPEVGEIVDFVGVPSETDNSESGS